MKREPRVAILILTYNPFNEHVELLENMLKSFDNLNYKNYKIYVADNGSPKKYLNNLENKFSKIKFIFHKKNWGFSIGNNLAIKTISKKYNPDYFLLLNDDMVINDKDFLKKMVNVGEQNKYNGIMGCMNIFEDGSLQWYAKNGKIYFFKKKGISDNSKEIYKNQEVEQIVGCNLLIKKDVVKKIGMFDEELSPVYGDETDLCFRTTKSGYKCIYVGNSQIIHLRDQTIKELDELDVFYSRIKNSIRVEWLNLSWKRIAKSSISHFVACVLKKEDSSLKINNKIFRRFKILFRAYKINVKKLSEIKRLREERNNFRAFE